MSDDIDDITDIKVKKALSKYLEAKRNHEYNLNEKRQQEQYYSQKAKSVIDEIIIPAMKSICESFKKHSGIDCVVTKNVKDFKFSEKENSVLFMTNPQIGQDEKRCLVWIYHNTENSFSVTCEWDSNGPQIEHSKVDLTDITNDSICDIILDTIEKNFSREWSFGSNMPIK